jgi:hypothetical protein
MSIITKSIGYSNQIQLIDWNNSPTAIVTAYLWGAGGGGGGNDAGSPGGSGAGGGYSKVTFQVSGSDQIYLAVGGGGVAGSSNGIVGGNPGGSYSGAIVFNTLNLVAGNIQRSSNAAYCSWLNANGVWYNYAASELDITTTVNFPLTGLYTFTVSADNSGTVYLDGNPVVSADTFTNVFRQQITVTAGLHSLRIRGVNTGGPASIGVMVVGDFSFGGGYGGDSGSSGTSGAGGGGGGASILVLNTTLLAVAAGGGGGGGAGISGTRSGDGAPGSRGNAASGTYAGQDGEDKSGDGGGGGGGGGGYGGGNGGAVRSGDQGAGAGSNGTSYAAPGYDGETVTSIGRTPGQAGSSLRPGNAGQGGATRTNGDSGAIVLEIIQSNLLIRYQPDPTDAFLIWKPVGVVWVKQNGIWQQSRGIWIKDDGVWNLTLPSNDYTPEAIDDPGVFCGFNPRQFS